MSDSSTIYVANESFFTTLEGEPVVVRKDVTRVRAGHPLLKGREKLFDPIKVHYEVEQATASPGERRGERQATPEVVAEPVAEPAAEPEAKPEPKAATPKPDVPASKGPAK